MLLEGSGAPVFHPFSLQATLTSATVEQETANNTAQNTVVTEVSTYNPHVNK